MSLRIDRIKVNRGGPLDGDFEFEPGDLNLVFGRNETGKTYVVESLIRLLFKTNSRAPVDWDLRGWDIAGRAIVSGLEKDPVTFKKSGDKLEDYWDKGPGLPSDLSRLLVVRAGETALANAGDGVGRDVLKAYLSGEGLLDRVAERISTTIRKTVIDGSLIDGDDRGELKKRDSAAKALGRLQDLIDEVEEGYASGDTYLLRQERDDLAAQVGTLDKAKRYHAGLLAAQGQGLQSEKDDLPGEGDLATLEADVNAFETNSAEIETMSEELRGLESTSTNYSWAVNALDDYKEFASRASGSGPKMALLILAALSLIGTVAFGLLGLRTPLVVSGVVSALFGALAYLDLKKAAASAGDNAELEKLKTEYRSRFGRDLTDQATLKAKLDELKEKAILAAPLKESLDGLVDDTRALEKKTTATLKAWTGNEVPVEQWREAIGGLTRKRGCLQDQIKSIGRELTSVGVPDHEYVAEDPRQEWDSERYTGLTAELERVDGELDQKQSELDQLKARVGQETGGEHSDWEELITALHEKREEAAREYRTRTAEILAKIQVNTVIQEFRLQENSRIAEGLKREELTEPLRALTGHYRSIRLDDDQGLVLVTDDDEDYPLSELSTGAREQTFLALRMGFASIAMEGKTGFLILDDAFQHSDWGRRENMVEHILSFVRSGWQVFYFTMDDHIRGLFEQVGEGMSDGFQGCDLG